ncbi:MAG TPA: DUF418 domain-containing protein [Chitinophagaceae bacterium]|nr:DUF418 domain-containing protein [Chitinophagaceae bacterium]
MQPSTPVHNLAAPTGQSERIKIIDSLRGIALLGILLMNIPYMGLPEPAFDNLVLNNELGTINEKVWRFVNWIPEGTQRAIFSMLFGAGIMLFTSRLEKRTEGMWPAEYFLRRQLWLLVFGLFNAFVLLWPGDILFEYAIIGIVAFVFRRLKPKWLLVAAGVCMLLMTVRENKDFYERKHKIYEGEQVAKLDTTKVKLTDVQQEKLGAMTGMKERSDTAKLRKDMKRNLEKSLGSYAELYHYISNVSVKLEFQFTYYGIWDVLLFMLIGMAFFKTGVLTGQVSSKVYWLMTIIGLGVGLFITWLWLDFVVKHRFNGFEMTKNGKFMYYEIARTFRSLGLFGLIMLLYKSGLFKWLFALVRPVGQMAFTNYLMQSFMCGLFFFGIGFGMLGKLQRYEIYYVVVAVWIIEIIWSHIWLRYFRFGPFEWLWRSLTYWKKQPMRRENKKDVLSP